jgi:hypothetical protein
LLKSRKSNEDVCEDDYNSRDECESEDNSDDQYQSTNLYRPALEALAFAAEINKASNALLNKDHNYSGKAPSSKAVGASYYRPSGKGAGGKGLKYRAQRVAFDASGSKDDYISRDECESKNEAPFEPSARRNKA